MILRESGKIISDTKKIVDTFNKFYVNIGNNLKIDKEKRFLVETNHVFDPILKEIKKFNNQPCIFSIFSTR